MSDFYGEPPRRRRRIERPRRRHRPLALKIWNLFVMAVGYAAILYGLALLVVHVLEVLGGGAS